MKERDKKSLGGQYMNQPSWVERRWEEVALDIGHITTVALLKVVWINQLFDFVLVIITEDKKLFIRKFINEFVCELPKLTHDKSYISGVEPEQATTVVLRHIAH